MPILNFSVENVGTMIEQGNLGRLQSEYELIKSPYSFLSAGNGEVIAIKNNNQKAVFFYTFRGTPSGRQSLCIFLIM